MKPRPLSRVTVCGSCLRASCCQGVFACEKFGKVATKSMAYADLDELGREHPHFWTKEWAEAAQRRMAELHSVPMGKQ